MFYINMNNLIVIKIFIIIFILKYLFRKYFLYFEDLLFKHSVVNFVDMYK